MPPQESDEKPTSSKRWWKKTKIKINGVLKLKGNTIRKEKHVDVMKPIVNLSKVGKAKSDTVLDKPKLLHVMSDGNIQSDVYSTMKPEEVDNLIRTIPLDQHLIKYICETLVKQPMASVEQDREFSLLLLLIQCKRWEASHIVAEKIRRRMFQVETGCKEINELFVSLNNE